ncbi:hypothetical protein L1887_55344 [Cichorium endivia]|nr:hypothetical protein L1887_55344 [Cichorium endivia]
MLISATDRTVSTTRPPATTCQPGSLLSTVSVEVAYIVTWVEHIDHLRVRSFGLHPTYASLSFAEPLCVSVPAARTHDGGLRDRCEHVLPGAQLGRIEKRKVEPGALFICLLHFQLGRSCVCRRRKLRGRDDASDDARRLRVGVELRKVRQMHALKRLRQRPWQRYRLHSELRLSKLQVKEVQEEVREDESSTRRVPNKNCADEPTDSPASTLSRSTKQVVLDPERPSRASIFVRSPTRGRSRAQPHHPSLFGQSHSFGASPAQLSHNPSAAQPKAGVASRGSSATPNCWLKALSRAQPCSLPTMSAATPSSMPSFGDRHLAPTMSPHDPSLRSLMGSLFEPNFLILARRAQDHPPESGELGLLNEHGDMSFERCMQAHDTLFHPEQHHRHRRSDTRAADTLIRIANWAFKSDAARAKLLFCLLALLSLGSTWYYMIAFLRHSYASYLERCHLTGYLLPPEPPAFRLDAPHLLAPSVHLRLLRISQWLGSLSLFKEAWMEVIRDAPAWWWSSEICIVTVGAWALFLRHESKRLRMPHVWIVMALGQLVAISFALNLFQLAVVYRLDTRDLLAARADKVHKPKHRVIEPLDQSPSPSPEPSPEDDPDAGPFRVMMVAPERQRPYFASREGLPPTPRDSPDPDMRVISTNVIVQRKPLPPVPTLMDKVGRILQRCIPERVGLPVFVLAGLSSVLQHPDSFTKVMIMHLFPLLISLYPAYDQFGVAEHGPRSRPRSRFGSNVGHSPSPPPTMLLTKKQALRKLLARSNPDVRALQDPKTFYLGLGLASVVLRAWLTSSCFSQTKGRRLDAAARMGVRSSCSSQPRSCATQRRAPSARTTCASR